jgi:pyruvyltransferase
VSELAAWAWTRPNGKPPNFGDELGPVILSRLGYTVRRVPLSDADIIACGSVLEAVASAARPGAIVWGAGLMHGRPVDVSRLDVRAVRGRLTATTLGLNVPLGDPGVLVPSLWNRPRVKHRLGVVRHYVDTNPYPDADVVIDVDRPVDEVVRAIGECATIASSSLHGLIVATAWEIPAVRLPHANVVGGDFKWLDWISAAHGSATNLRLALP